MGESPDLGDFLAGPVSAPAPVERAYLRLIDFCITQLKAQGPSRTCNESKEEEEEEGANRLSIDTVLNLRTTTSQKCKAVPRRARI